MKPERWARLYGDIVQDLGLDAGADAEAARLLSSLLPRAAPPAGLARRLDGRRAHVLGAGPALATLDLRRVPRPLVATDGACRALAAAGILPDVVVTDLDGDAAAQAVFAAKGAFVCVAAHGDNLEALRRWAPRFAAAPAVLGTTQVPGEEDLAGVLRTPGFTDGDRACFLAAGAGASAVVLHAFDLERPGPESRDPERKRRKLAWARRLLEELPVPWETA